MEMSQPPITGGQSPRIEFWPHSGHDVQANETTGALGKVHPFRDGTPVYVEDVGRLLPVRALGVNAELLCRSPRA